MKLTLISTALLALSLSSISAAQSCVCGTPGTTYTEDDIINAEKAARLLSQEKQTLNGYPKPIRGTKDGDLHDRCGPTEPLFEFPLRANNKTYDGTGHTTDKIFISGVTKDGQPGVGTYCGCITVGPNTAGDAYHECMYKI